MQNVGRLRRIRVGISSCLLGENVRYDGGHKLDLLITEILGKYFEWVPVCPEVEIGLGTPRETLHLEQTASRVRLVGTESGADHTAEMADWAGRRLPQLELQEMSGYILKKNSPSCGMERVRIYNASGVAVRNGSGLFAALLRKGYKLLPVEEEGRLHDPDIRENFVERVFAHHRWRKFLKQNSGARALAEFHERHKLTLLAHDEACYRRLGRIVAAGGKRPPSATLDKYGVLFMRALQIPATRPKHAGLLHHIIGYFRDELDAIDREELDALIEHYQKGLVPLAVPLTLIRQHLRRHPAPLVRDQVYLDPYPAEFMTPSRF